MSLKDSFKKLMFIDEDEEFTEEEIREEEQKQKKEKKEKKVSRDTQHVEPVAQKTTKPERTAPLERRISVTNNSFKLILIEPESFDECKKLVDSLKARRPIIINLEKIETETAKKIFDFLSGATYALNGSIQKVSNNIFIFAPDNVGICDENKTQEGKGFEFATEASSPWRK